MLELKESIKQLQSEGKEILLFFDLVYIHYSKLNINKIFEIFSDFPFFFNFSSSKTLSLYGFRAGCLCLYSKIEEDLKLFPEKIAFSARASTGSINHYGYNIIEKFSNNSNIFELETSWEFVKTNLRLRADKLVAIFNAHDIEYYRYDEGFFFSFYSKKCDINLLFNKLKENGIFFIPQKETIRVAISSISIDKLDELEKRFDILL